MSILTIDNHSIDLTHPQKILFPADGITKGELVAYYNRIAPIMIPYMQERLISMQRFPSGIDQEGFYQKDAGSYFPDWVTTKTVKKKEGGVVHYVMCNNATTLVYLANQLCITPHLWLSKVDALRYPDRMIFDLDPSGTDFSLIIAAARALKKLLESHGLTPFVMTTGSRGLHVVVPLLPVRNFTYVRSFALSVAKELVHSDPHSFTLEMRKNKRQGRVFIDYLRNAYGATGVAPYAIRPLPGAPIATPLVWSEVKAGLSPQRYTLKNIFRRLSRRADPWHAIDAYAVKLGKFSK